MIKFHFAPTIIQPIAACVRCAAAAVVAANARQTLPCHLLCGTYARACEMAMKRLRTEQSVGMGRQSLLTWHGGRSINVDNLIKHTTSCDIAMPCRGEQGAYRKTKRIVINVINYSIN